MRSESQDDKRQRTALIAQPFSVHRPAAWLLQLPVAVVNLVYHLLPWYERVLHVSRVHAQLPTAWLVWTEYDHVRLNEALLMAVEGNHPSALHCCRHVQSLYVERVLSDELAYVDESDDEEDCESMDEEECHTGGQHSKRPSTRLERLVQSIRSERSVAPLPSATPAFGCLRSLVSSHVMFHSLLELCDGLQHLHSLSLYSSDTVDVHRMPTNSSSHALSLSDYLWSLPTLRRLRVEGIRVLYSDILALPCLEHVDLRRAYIPGDEKPEGAPSSPYLHCLLLEHLGKLGDNRMRADHLLATLVPSTSLQHLSIKARLTNDDLLTLTSLHSLTALELKDCDFDDTNALGRLMSDKSEPLLPNLQRFAIQGSDAEHINYEDMRTSTAAFLHAYSRQLRHLKLSVKTDPANSLAAVLFVITSRMTQLESLELEVQYNNWNDPYQPLSDIVQPSSADEQQQQQTPALPALRSLALRNLPMADAAVEQLLACCPHLLELTLDRVGPLTAAVWPSLLHCTQLLSLCFYSASQVACEADITQVMASLSSSPQSSTAAAFPSLAHLSLAFNQLCDVDSRGFEQLLGLFAGSPITSLALRLSDALNNIPYVLALACLPHVTSLLLGGDEVDIPDEADIEAEEDGLVDRTVAQLLKEHSEPVCWSNDQHHTCMSYYWSDGHLGGEEDELRTMYANGVKRPFCRQSAELVERPEADARYRRFHQVQSDGRLDGRAMFFQSLEAEKRRLSGDEV